MIKKFHIRKAREEDIASVLATLHNLNKHQGDSKKPHVVFYQSYFFEFDVWIAEINSEIIGFIAASDIYLFNRGLKDCNIQSLFVSENHRKKGVARALLDQLISSKRETGTDIFSLCVSKGNVSARKLYESLNFDKMNNDKHLKYRLCCAAAH